MQVSSDFGNLRNQSCGPPPQLPALDDIILLAIWALRNGEVSPANQPRARRTSDVLFLLGEGNNTVDEVGPNDPNRGRSSIGGFKMPGSKPIEVRGLDDVHTASYGGFRKPKPKEEYTQDTLDISGGGYTPAQSNNDRRQLMMLFLGAPIALLAVVGVLGWLFLGDEEPQPLRTECTEDGYFATFDRTDFHREVTVARVNVTFSYDVDTTFLESADIELSPEVIAPRVVIAAPDLDALGAVVASPIPTCTLESIELNPET